MFAHFNKCILYNDDDKAHIVINYTASLLHRRQFYQQGVDVHIYGFANYLVFLNIDDCTIASQYVYI